MLRFSCPRCARPFKSSTMLAGQRTQCPGCGHAFAVPTHDPERTTLHVETAQALPVARVASSEEEPPRKRNDYPLIAFAAVVFLILSAVVMVLGALLIQHIQSAGPTWPELR